MAEFLINSKNSAQKGNFTLTFLNVKNLENIVFSRFLLVFAFIIDAGSFLLFCTLLRVIYFMIQIPFRSKSSLSIIFLSFIDFIIAEIVFRLWPNSIDIAVCVILVLFFINLITDISRSVNLSATFSVT